MYGPLGPEREDYRTALVAYVFACAFSEKGKEPKLSDFLLKFDAEPEEPQSPEQMLAMAETLNTAFGGRDLRQRKGD